MLIRKRRIDKGWSQETLAQVSGLSVRTVQRIERGGKASLETMNALAAVLDVDVPTLTKETGMNEQQDYSPGESGDFFTQQSPVLGSPHPMPPYVA